MNCDKHSIPLINEWLKFGPPSFQWHKFGPLLLSIGWMEKVNFRRGSYPERQRQNQRHWPGHRFTIDIFHKFIVFELSLSVFFANKWMTQIRATFESVTEIWATFAVEWNGEGKNKLPLGFEHGMPPPRIVGLTIKPNIYWTAQLTRIIWGHCLKFRNI